MPLNVTALEDRLNPAPLPVLMVIADQRDFYYQEYGDTAASLTALNVPHVVAATTTNPSTPHPNSGQGSSSGIVTPSITLAAANASNYSAIVFVGGWGSSMYQYAFNDPDLNGTTNNTYSNAMYNGDSNLNDGIIAPQKVAVNNLIDAFLDQNKPVCGVCHGVTVLAWARVDGVSPLSGKTVAVPLVQGTPAMTYNGTFYPAGYSMGQYIQGQANGAYVLPTSGQYGNPGTPTDDVIVDGKIITAQDNNSAAAFGTAIGQRVLADALITNPTAPTVLSAAASSVSRLTSITVNLAQPVDLTTLSKPGAINLTNGTRNLSTGTHAAGRIHVAQTGSSQYTLTFSNSTSNLLEGGSLPDGVWRLSIPDANFSQTYVRFFGDYNGDRTVDGNDFAFFGTHFGRTINDSPFDQNGDNTIDGQDFAFFGTHFGRTI